MTGLPGALETDPPGAAGRTPSGPAGPILQGTAGSTLTDTAGQSLPGTAGPTWPGTADRLLPGSAEPVLLDSAELILLGSAFRLPGDPEPLVMATALVRFTHDDGDRAVIDPLLQAARHTRGRHGHVPRTRWADELARALRDWDCEALALILALPGFDAELCSTLSAGLAMLRGQAPKPDVVIAVGEAVSDWLVALPGLDLGIAAQGRTAWASAGTFRLLAAVTAPQLMICADVEDLAGPLRGTRTPLTVLEATYDDERDIVIVPAERDRARLRQAAHVAFAPLWSCATIRETNRVHRAMRRLVGPDASLAAAVSADFFGDLEACGERRIAVLCGGLPLASAPHRAGPPATD